MASITAKKRKDGSVVSYKFTLCVGRDGTTNRQIWRTHTVQRPLGLTPKKEEKEVKRLADEWEKAERERFNQSGSKRTNNKEKDRVTLAAFIRDKWLINNVRNGKHTPATVAFYEYMSADIISYYGEHIRVNEFDREDIEKYEAFLRTKATTKKGDKLSETSVRRHLETLRNVLRYARKNKYIAEDVFENYPIETKSDAAETVDYLSEAEIYTLFERLETADIFWQAYIRIALSCGLRRGEELALTWADVDMEDKHIVVRKNVTVAVSESKGYNIGATKGKQQRTVYFTDAVKNVLEKLHERQREKYGKLPVNSFIFCSTKDPTCPLYPTTPTTWLRRFEKRNGLRELSPHDLRHSAGVLAKMAGADLKDIQTMLGHRDLKTTAKFYLAADEKALRKTASGIDSIIEANTPCEE